MNSGQSYNQMSAESKKERHSRLMKERLVKIEHDFLEVKDRFVRFSLKLIYLFILTLFLR